MRPLDVTRPVLAMMLALAIGACSKDDAPPTEQTEPTQQTEQAKPSAEPVEEAKQPAKPVTAPFTVELQAPDKVPARGLVELTAVIDVSKTFEGNTSISVEVPDGAKLVGGEAKEELDGLPQGKTERTFKVNFTKKPNAEEPVKVIVEGQDKAGTFGARAERRYPATSQ